MEGMEETDPMMEKKEDTNEEEISKESSCNCGPLFWAAIIFFVVLIFIGLCFWKMSLDDSEKREHTPYEDEKRNSDEQTINGKPSD